ncbi:MAG: hypothetical protein HQ542_01790, partial [Bacteroidia bacterium]|nr:hypothetical protein [Bacteroidia bacterium]
YLPRVPYLKAILHSIAIRNPDAIGFKKCVWESGLDIESLKFRFWPSYATPVGLPGSSTEPDVQLSGSKILVFFEAKLHSGFGELQIERELAVGLKESGNREFFLVVVTPGISHPRIRYRGRKLKIGEYLHALSSTPEISKSILDQLSENADRILWISWHSIVSSLNSTHQQHRNMVGITSAEMRRTWDIIGDLNELMLMRGIQPFNGFSHIVQQGPTVRTNKAFLPGIPAPLVLEKRLRLDSLPGLLGLKPLPEKNVIFYHATERSCYMRFSLETLPKLTDVTSIPEQYFPKFPQQSYMGEKCLRLTTLVHKCILTNNPIKFLSWMKKEDTLGKAPDLFAVVNKRLIKNRDVELFQWRRQNEYG